MTKSFGTQPQATPRPTRPCDRLSTTAHSSATRIGSCSGSTTLPAHSCTRCVRAASAAHSTEGFGDSPPKLWKWRSGVHSRTKPCWSAHAALSRIRR